MELFVCLHGLRENVQQSRAVEQVRTALWQGHESSQIFTLNHEWNLSLFRRADAGAMLTHDFIFEVVLPPLLFEAALCIRWRELRRDLVVVLTPSTLGVVISAVVVGAGMMHLLAWPAAPALFFMGEPPISRKAFGNKLGGRPGIEPVTIGHKKARGYRGIRVITVETATNWRDD